MLPAHALPRWSRQVPGLLLPEVHGFIEFNIDHPVARKFIAQHLRAAVPMTKDSPGLFSYCLTNEPEYLASGRDPYSKPLWIAYLRRHHTLDELNELYGTHYRQFGEVPVPAAKMPDTVELKRAFYDWVMFNHEHQSDWHRWMNGIIKSIAPNVPTHTKTMRVLDVSYADSIASVPDPELLCEFTDLAGNDAWSTLPAHEGPDAMWWRSQEIWYDLLYSFRGQPVFDSENHTLTIPYGPLTVPPAQTRCAIWQGALHHRWATVLWVWQKWSPQTHCGESDLTGTIYFRPANLHAAGRTMIDMNRFADELAAINADKPKVALLYSQPAAFWDTQYGPSLRAAYTSLVFSGVPVTFVSERQLTANKFSPANVEVNTIVIPSATHVSQAAIAGLQNFVRRGGRIIRIGSDSLSRDEYDRSRLLGSPLVESPVVAESSDEHELMRTMIPILDKLNLSRVKLQSATGEVAWGVEYRVVSNGERVLVPIVSFNEQPISLKLNLAGRAIDMLTGAEVNLDQIELQPMQPMLLSVSKEPAGHLPDSATK